MRKQTLFAGRVKGDLAPGLEPTRLGGDGAKAWARMDFPGRRLPGQPDQGIYEVSAGTQKFEIGTRRIEYGRTFRYALAGETTATAAHAFLLGNGNYSPEVAGHLDEHGFYGDLYEKAEEGQKYLDLEMADTSETYDANYFQGGYVTVFATNFYNTYYIVASDASGADYCRIYLDRGIAQDITADQGIEVQCSPYSNIVDCGVVDATWMSVVGRALCQELTLGDYFWLQTGGPCWVQPTDWETQSPGYASYKRDVYANVDGSCCLQVTTGSLQRIGYLLSRTLGGYGAALIMLQLDS